LIHTRIILFFLTQHGRLLHALGKRPASREQLPLEARARDPLRRETAPPLRSLELGVLERGRGRTQVLLRRQHHLPEGDFFIDNLLHQNLHSIRLRRQHNLDVLEHL